jgi:hypothetical protein
MSRELTFWPVEHAEGEPDLLVCMSCLNEVFCRKVPMPDCPSCHGVSTYEAFTLESIRDWGTTDLISKAEAAQAAASEADRQALRSAPEPSVESEH